MDNLSPAQYDRFEAYRRHALPKQAVRKVKHCSFHSQKLSVSKAFFFSSGNPAIPGATSLHASRANHRRFFEGLCRGDGRERSGTSRSLILSFKFYTCSLGPLLRLLVSQVYLAVSLSRCCILSDELLISSYLFVARAVQSRRGETGPLSPDHLREAYRAYQEETGHVGAARPLRAKKLFVR